MLTPHSNKISILIAEDNDISRELMSNVLKTQGFDIISARDGDEAIAAIEKQLPDLAFVDLNMKPKDGFSFVQHLVTFDIKIPIVIVTAEESTDILTKAQKLGVTRVLQKPVEPDRLVNTAKAVLKRYDHNLNAVASKIYDIKHSPNQLIQRAIDLAEQNAKFRKGGPFGAIVASGDGIILGEGVNGIASRVDPTAHAEIMAIRKTVEKLDRQDLSDCILYCSSEPTMIGKALIISVGIKQIYYGLSHKDIEDITPNKDQFYDKPKNESKFEAVYTQTNRNDAMKMFKRWQK